jgi:hypothetical protein
VPVLPPTDKLFTLTKPGLKTPDFSIDAYGGARSDIFKHILQVVTCNAVVDILANAIKKNEVCCDMSTLL